MSPEAKKRCEELAYKEFPPAFVGGIDLIAARREGYFSGYKAGYNDPDRQGLLEECEKQIRHSYNCDYHVRRYDRDCTCGASAVIEKLKAARG